jgi:protein-S-isoprenylcysteine O-methyltransferase Ste14
MRHVVYNIAEISIVVCWTAVGAVWLVGALLERRRGSEVAGREGRDIASAAAGAGGVVVALAPAAWWRPIVVASPALRVAGIPLLLTATAGAIWARVALGRMWSSGALTREAHILRTTGPYRFSRHPIYTAIIAMVAATALCEGIGRWAAILLLVAVMLTVKAHLEERLLLREFGPMYGRYRTQVPRLIPSVRRVSRQP